MSLNDRQAVEYFHLVFLRALLARGEDKALIAVKGGCNLRFFFGSVRYSEDIDLDVTVVSKSTLKNKVDRLLESPLLAMPLKNKGLVLVDISAPKQTETTQRWKLGIQMAGSGSVLRTKIEFSRRDKMEGARVEACHSNIMSLYGLTPVLANHYLAPGAIKQKVHALAARPEPQARDVFDLHLLFASLPSFLAPEDIRTWIDPAITNTEALSYDAYIAQVVAYLDPEHAVLYEEEAAWEQMKEQVIARLDSMR